MNRLCFVALLACLCLASMANASADDKPSPAVKRILDKAVAEVRKNRQEFDKANAMPLGDARAELRALSTKLINDGKTVDATAVLKQIETLEADVMRMANAPAPIPAGGGRTTHPTPLLERMEGKWERDKFGDGYLFQRNGVVEARSKANGRVTNTARCQALTDESGVVEWSSGHRWAFRVVGDDWVAIRETKGGEATCSGIVLTRIK